MEPRSGYTEHWMQPERCLDLWLHFAVLAFAHTRFDVVFVTAFSIAVMGLGVLVFFVNNPVPSTGDHDVRPSLRTSAAP